MQGLRASRWSPYAVGTGIGVLSGIAFVAMGQGLGISGSFEDAGGLVERALVPGWADLNGWAREHHPRIDGTWALVAGVILGGLTSAALSEPPPPPEVPPLWRRRFGRSLARRLGWAFFGGALMMFGARVAGGCTTGHGLTGALSLAVSSWAFTAVAIASAMVTAFSLFGGVGGGHARLPR